MRSAVRWLTERTNKGGVLDISCLVDDGPKTVFDVLKEKHPEPSIPPEDAYLKCVDLPPLADVDITSSHIEIAAKKIQGGAGPGGSTTSLWQALLLHFGVHSANLRDAMAELARRLSNSIIDWSDTQALSLMSTRLVALDKSPGVRPIAIG